MGISSLFDVSSADLRRIVDAPLAIDRVIQSALIEVDERGTEAAAATGGMGGGMMTTPLQTMIVDRPFLFLIRDVRSGALLFLARVANPVE
jgi:serpin B